MTFLGIGLGLTLCIPAVYIVEISSANHRGVLGVLPNLFCQVHFYQTFSDAFLLDLSLGLLLLHDGFVGSSLVLVG
jgi:hypothetical protein